MFDPISVGKRTIAGAALCLSALAGNSALAAPSSAPRPNIVFIMADNFGWGELGVYGGGALRGAPTPRIDALAATGMRLNNFNVEPTCTPCRASFLTGRFSVRSGAFGESGHMELGLTQWEVTSAELLSAQGYTTAMYGKWHLGDRPGRYPTDQGFDEWYGIPRSSNLALLQGSPGWDPKYAEPEYVLEGKKGGTVRRIKLFDMQVRGAIDGEIADRAAAYIRSHAHAKQPFYLYLPLTQVHAPTIPSKAFKGRTGNGDFADAVVEMDHNVGEIVDAIDEAGIAKDTIVIFASDNGPDEQDPWRGTSGYWRGYMRTALEGSLRAPFIIRWPDHVPAGAVNNEIVHIVDMFPTFARLAGAPVPTDRAIDGVDQADFFLGRQKTSNREGFPIYRRGEPYAVKWHDWKMHMVWWPDVFAKNPENLASPYVFNLLTDPKEMAPWPNNYENRWAIEKMRDILADFQESLKKWPPVPPGAPDPYAPSSSNLSPRERPVLENSGASRSGSWQSIVQQESPDAR